MCIRDRYSIFFPLCKAVSFIGYYWHLQRARVRPRRAALRAVTGCARPPRLRLGPLRGRPRPDPRDGFILSYYPAPVTSAPACSTAAVSSCSHISAPLHNSTSAAYFGLIIKGPFGLCQSLFCPQRACNNLRRQKNKVQIMAYTKSSFPQPSEKLLNLTKNFVAQLLNL